MPHNHKDQGDSPDSPHVIERRAEDVRHTLFRRPTIYQLFSIVSGMITTASEGYLKTVILEIIMDVSFKALPKAIMVIENYKASNLQAVS